MPKYIRKRNGSIENFDANKIANAIKKALDATESKYENYKIDAMAQYAVSIINCSEGFVVDDIVDIETVQDVAERILDKYDYFDAARAFILYRENRTKLREQKETIDKFAIKLISGSLGTPKENDAERADPCAELDVIRNQNASTAGGTIGASILQVSEAMSKLFWESVYDPEINDFSQIGDKNYFYLHDLGMVAPYCAGWSFKELIKRGLGGVDNKIASAPPKHLTTACTQLVNFLGIMQNEWAGAQAVSSFDTYLAPFVKIDNLQYKDVKQAMQIFVFGANVSSRWGSQCPFSNITIDWVVPDDLVNLPAIVDGKEQDFTYGDCQKEADIINKALLEVMIDGDANGRGFQYPIITYNITREFDWSDTPNNELLFTYAAKYGGPYFSNYINSDNKPSDVRSMCCRLRLDLRELRKQNGGNFGAGENTGSIGVVTIDLPQLAYISNTEDEFFTRLEYVMGVAARSLDTKRRIINYYLERGAYPYTKSYLYEGLKNHFSTIGLVGMNEACLNAKWLKKDLTNKECLKWAEKVLDFMRNKLSDFQELYGCLFNLEATPAESTCYTLARKDKKKYPDIITAGKPGETPYYTNSSHLPVEKIDNIFDALDMEDNLQIRYTSGTVFHAFLGERLPSWESAANLVRTIAENYKLPYFTLSPTYSICKKHGYINGEVKVCPYCGEETEIYSRITGYYRPVSNWNAGKTQEFEDRKTYNMNKLDKLESNHIDNTDKVEFNIVANDIVKQNNDLDINITKNFVDNPNDIVIKDNILELATTHTCPNCTLVKRMLDDKGIRYDTIYVDDDIEYAKSHDIQSVPVLFIGSDRYDGAGNIIRYISGVCN